MDDGYALFHSSATAAANAGCDDGAFCCLSANAIAMYKADAQRGERIAEIMSSIWVKWGEYWQVERADAIGKLFADLDLPLHHVAGGNAGARKKWRDIERLVAVCDGQSTGNA
jgi:hypothetical protein